MRNLFFSIKATAVFTALTLCGNVTAVKAAGFRVDVEQCDTSRGSIAVEDANTEAWSTLEVDDPTGFVTSAVAQSGCFTVAESSAQAQYRISVGPLTKDEYDAGPSQFSGRPSIGATGGTSEEDANGPGGVDKALGGIDKALKGGFGSFLGGSNMDYAFFDIKNASGEVLSRGFGRSNATKLDYSHWTYDQAAVQRFNEEKKSRRAGGAMFNAFHEAQKSVLASNFGSAQPVYAKTGSPGSIEKSSAQLTVKELFEERRKNGERFFNKYAAINGGSYVTLSGFVSKSNARSKWVLLSGSQGFPTTALSGVTCENVASGSTLLDLDKDDPITVRGTLMILTKDEVFRGDYGLGDPLSIRDCSIVKP